MQMYPCVLIQIQTDWPSHHQRFIIIKSRGDFFMLPSLLLQAESLMKFLSVYLSVRLSDCPSLWASSARICPLDQNRAAQIRPHHSAGQAHSIGPNGSRRPGKHARLMAVVAVPVVVMQLGSGHDAGPIRDDGQEGGFRSGRPSWTAHAGRQAGKRDEQIGCRLDKMTQSRWK